MAQAGFYSSPTVGAKAGSMARPNAQKSRWIAVINPVEKAMLFFNAADLIIRRYSCLVIPVRAQFGDGTAC